MAQGVVRSLTAATFAAWVLADAPEYLTGAVLSVDGGMTAG